MSTHTFKLLSGVEAEVKAFEGKHQRILTEGKSRPFTEKLNEVLADVLVRVGSEQSISVAFVENMLSGDRRKALAEARQFTMEFDPVFKFTYKYVSEEKKMEDSIEKEINLENGFPEVPYKQQAEEYKDIIRDVETVLPKTKKKVRFTMLDGKGEANGARTKKDERSSHTAIYMRNPKELTKPDEGKEELPIRLDLDRLPIKDIEHLRTVIKEYEGRIDTEIMFEHPEAENKPPHEKNVITDLLGVLAFFFPSEAL